MYLSCRAYSNCIQLLAESFEHDSHFNSAYRGRARSLPSTARNQIHNKNAINSNFMFCSKYQVAEAEAEPFIHSFNSILSIEPHLI